MDPNTMDFDNPSYFSVSGGAPPTPNTNQLITNQTIAELIKMGGDSITSSSSDNFLNRKSLDKIKTQWPSIKYSSLSSNESSREMLLLGGPRLSDMAPELATTNRNKSNSGSLKFSRSNYNNNNDKNNRNEYVYSSLPTSERSSFDESTDQIFVENETSTARYINYNPEKKISNLIQSSNQRRHSIGTFVNRERSNSLSLSTKSSFKEEEVLSESSENTQTTVSTATTFTTGVEIHCSPLEENNKMTPPCNSIDEHSLRHASFPRKRCNRCVRGVAQKIPNMEDIQIVSLKSSEAASLWVEYFSSYFQQISKQAKREEFKIQHLGIEDIIQANGNVKQLEDRAIGFKLQLVIVCPAFLDYIAEHLEYACSLGKILIADKTLALLLGVSDSNVTEIHRKALSNYFQWQRHAVGKDQDENFTKDFLGQAMGIFSKIWKQQSSVVNDSPTFSVSPKKIRQGQNSVFILLSYPLQKEDVIKISIEKNNELYEVKSVKRRNPYTIKISVPENLTEVTAIVNILVEKNGSIIGSRPVKCESKLRELEQCLRSCNNPVEFMCQALGFTATNKEYLDNWLIQAFQSKIPTHFNLFANNSANLSNDFVQKHNREEFPTLLHFSAKYGLEKLTLQLLDCPGAEIAYEIKNIYDMTPAEIAESNGHIELAHTLRGYMNMNEFTNMYHKLRAMSEYHHKDSTNVVDGEYVNRKCVDEFYKWCPPPRPVNVQIERPKTPVTPVTPVTPGSDIIQSSIEYMNMNPPSLIHKPHFKTQESVESNKSSDSRCTSPPPQCGTEYKQMCPVNKNLQSKKQHASQQEIAQQHCFYDDKVQKELLEIINDFKNNVHSISQVEKLVEEWKNRNDVQKSFKEKQEQLREMRMQYEKIQQEIKAAMKKPSPFDRFKRMFSYTKPKSKEDPHSKQEVSLLPYASSTPNIIVTSGNPALHRPISGLSNLSCSSSGRTSTISGSSLGDSGTHSDNDDRKLEKPIIRPDTLTLQLEKEYYIQFPPSGLPVPGLMPPKEKEESENIFSNQYMNISANTTPTATNEYMNYKITSIT